MILSHNNFDHLKKLVDSLLPLSCEIFIHLDKRVKNPPIFATDRVHVLPIQHKVQWCGFSTIETTLYMLTCGIEKKFDRYIFLSGVDYPVKSLSYIEQYLANSTNQYMNIAPMPQSHKPMDRVDYFYFEVGRSVWGQRLNLGIRLLQKLLGYKRTLPDAYKNYRLYGGSMWWSVTGECAEYILSFVKDNPTFTNFFRHTWVPDEMFFQTIVGNSMYADSIAPGITGTVWDSGSASPVILDTVSVQPLLDNPALLFARKFSNQSNEVVDYINEQVHNSSLSYHSGDTR